MCPNLNIPPIAMLGEKQLCWLETIFRTEKDQKLLEDFQEWAFHVIAAP